MTRSHQYEAHLRWRGQDPASPVSYTSYSRDYEIACAGKAPIAGSADPAFHGDPARHNPEDLFIAAVSACHMLTYLALCARRGIHVVSYEDTARGTMQTDPPPGWWPAGMRSWPARFITTRTRPASLPIRFVCPSGTIP